MESFPSKDIFSFFVTCWLIVSWHKVKKGQVKNHLNLPDDEITKCKAYIGYFIF